MDNQNNPNLPNNLNPPDSPQVGPVNPTANGTGGPTIFSSAPNWPTPSPSAPADFVPAPTAFTPPPPAAPSLFDASSNLVSGRPSDSTQTTPAPFTSDNNWISPATPTTSSPQAEPDNRLTADPTPGWTPSVESAPATPTAGTPMSPTDTWSALPSSPPSVNTPSPQDPTATWTPPGQQNPYPQEPAPQVDPLAPSSIPGWSPSPQPPQSSEPTPTFVPPQPSPLIPNTGTLTSSINDKAGNSEPNLSPLDNPWGAPLQPPPIDGSQSQSPIQPSWMNASQNAEPNVNTGSPAPFPGESVPTDLSHLISGNSIQSTQPAPETLVVPPVSLTPEVPTLPTENHKGMPGWLIGLGIALLVLVGGASAYFILGIGQPSKGTTSLPATVATNEVKTPAPIATPVPQPSSTPPAATGSANFGSLQGGDGNQGATSAASLLRQRQQQGR